MNSCIRNILVVILALTLTLLSCGSSDTYNSPNQQGGQIASTQRIVINIPEGSTGKGAAAYGTNPQIVKAGTTVTWINQDSMIHTATSDTGIWDSGILSQGQSYSFEFKNIGNYPYYCTVHGVTSMSGVIQVN